MKKTLFIAFLIVFCFASHAFALKECKVLFISKRYRKAIKYCDSAALKNNDSAYFYLGKIYLNLNQPSTAFEFFKKYKQLALKNNNIGKAYKYMAISYLNLYLRYKYLYYKDNLINMPSNEGYQTNLYMSMNNLAALHLVQKYFNKTIADFHKSLQISPINLKAKIFNDLSYAYFFDNNIKKSIFFEKKAVKNAQANRNLKKLPLYLFNLSYFKFAKRHLYNPKNSIWQKNYLNFLYNLKKYALKLSASNNPSQISKLIDNAMKSN